MIYAISCLFHRFACGCGRCLMPEVFYKQLDLAWWSLFRGLCPRIPFQDLAFHSTIKSGAPFLVLVQIAYFQGEKYHLILRHSIFKKITEEYKQISGRAAHLPIPIGSHVEALHLLVADGSPLELRRTWDIVKEFIPGKPLPPAPDGNGWILLLCSADYSPRPVTSRDTQPSRFCRNTVTRFLCSYMFFAY